MGSIPDELKKLKFCVWRKEKKGKVPYNPVTGRYAKTNDANTFVSYEEAISAVKDWDGIGVRVSDDIGAIDIDNCIREDGSLTDIATNILSAFSGAYFEKSPSGKGLRGFFRLGENFAYDRTKYYIKKNGLEVYLPGVTNRFVTVTGDVYRDGNVVCDNDALLLILDKYLRRKEPVKYEDADRVSYLTDEQVIAHASSSEKFRDLMDGRWEGLYESHSDADMALVSMLAFWCGGVEEQIDRIFRTSGLMRDKWDRMTGDSTYGQITIRNAVATVTEVYVPIAAIDEFLELPSGCGDVSKITMNLENVQTNPRYGQDEIGIGNLFADYFKPIARYVGDRGAWFVFDGKKWTPDPKGLAVAELAKWLVAQLYYYALQIKDENTRKRFMQKVIKLQRQQGRERMLKDARSVYPLSMDDFDADKNLFNCSNGTIDISTGEFHAHSPDDFITKISPVEYNPAIRCARWERFIEEVMQGNQSVMRYLQKAVGYALDGDTSQECMFIMYGATTRNGKTTTIETILNLMGDYGRSARSDMLAAKGLSGGNGGPSEDIARLAGARFIGISEMEKKMSFNAALVKQLTGNNRITARYLHENSFEFYLQAKIFIDTNYLPRVSDKTLFESKRLKIIPFERHFEGHEQDKTLKDTLSKPESLSGILNWCLEGHRLYKEEGLTEPEDVILATEQYDLNSDPIAQFIKDCLVESKGSELKASAVYRRYKDWCSDNGLPFESAVGFYRGVKGKLVIEKRRPWDKRFGMNPTRFVNNIYWNDDIENL